RLFRQCALHPPPGPGPRRQLCRAGLGGLCELFLAGRELWLQRRPGLAQQSQGRRQWQCRGDAGQNHSAQSRRHDPGRGRRGSDGWHQSGRRTGLHRQTVFRRRSLQCECQAAFDRCREPARRVGYHAGMAVVRNRGQSVRQSRCALRDLFRSQRQHRPGDTGPDRSADPDPAPADHLPARFAFKVLTPSDPACAPDGAWRSVGLVANLTLRIASDATFGQLGRWPHPPPFRRFAKRGRKAVLVSKRPSLYTGAMLRLTDIKLPLDHGPEALKAAILKKLKLPADQLLEWQVFKRGHDARNRSAIAYIYTVDVRLKDESRAAKTFKPAPDMEYRPVASAPAEFQRPLVVGAGPCGLFAALILAQSGFRPIILERGKAVRERTKDTWGLWRRAVLNPESNVQFG